MLKVDPENTEPIEHIFGNALVVDLEIKKSLVDYEFGNALVVKTSLIEIEIECVNFLKMVDF